MLGFGFTVLVLVLASVALYFAYRYMMLRQAIRWKARRKAMLKRVAAQALATYELDRKVVELEMHARERSGFTPTVSTPFGRSEERHAKMMSQIVQVGDTPINNAG